MNRCGIAWIENYGDQPLLPLSEETATGFAKALGAQTAFELKEGQVAGALLEGGRAAGVEGAEIFYFAGHGSERGPLFSNGHPGVDIQAMDLGIGDLTYAVFDCCRMLDPFFLGRWEPAFEGLHYMLGFGGFVWQSEARGRTFASLLRCGIPIAEAWRRAAIETAGPMVPWAFLRALPEGVGPEDELWSNDKALSRRRGAPQRFLHRHEVPESEMPVPPSATPDRVPLFRIEPREWTNRRQRHQARRLELSEPINKVSDNGWSELRTETARLALYNASGSFWMLRGPSPADENAVSSESAAPATPSGAEAIERSRSFLVEKDLIGRTFMHSVSRTEEGAREIGEARTEGVGSGGSPIARHVNYSFRLRGLPVFGPGAKARVSYGSSGELTELLYFWRKAVQDGRTAPIITADDARKILRSSEAFKHLPDEGLEIGEGRLGYYSLPPRETQDFMLPVYELKGTFNRPDFKYEFTRYVQAIPEEGRPQDSEESVFRLPTVLP